VVAADDAGRGETPAGVEPGSTLASSVGAKDVAGIDSQRHHAACQRGAVFKTRAVPEEIGGFATTLLASVERCSRCWTP